CDARPKLDEVSEGQGEENGHKDQRGHDSRPISARGKQPELLSLLELEGRDHVTLTDDGLAAGHGGEDGRDRILGLLPLGGGLARLIIRTQIIAYQAGDGGGSRPVEPEGVGPGNRSIRGTVAGFR